MNTQQYYNLLNDRLYQEYLETQAQYGLAYSAGKRSVINSNIFNQYLISNQNLLTRAELEKEILSLPIFAN